MSRRQRFADARRAPAEADIAVAPARVAELGEQPILLRDEESIRVDRRALIHSSSVSGRSASESGVDRWPPEPALPPVGAAVTPRSGRAHSPQPGPRGGAPCAPG